ncbi:MAG TPA: non-homologous end-joining DNA ligase [Actinomycetota bacterium]|nr:non-homologous end-joining DNA ligase [Actinomycetota bacterium]
MLATLTERRFSDPDWIYERKLDGVRCLGFVHGRKVQLLTRNKLSANSSYPEVADALAEQELDMVVDGEVVAFRGRESSFELLQRRMHVQDPAKSWRSKVHVVLVAFDILHAGGFDCRDLPLRERKSLLRKLLRTGEALRISTHRNRDGEAFYDEACRRGWEGLIAKRADATYQGRRSNDWLKFKCVNEQELVIAGWTEPKGSRTSFGALLLGYHDAGEYRYGGKVGTGFDRATLGDLLARMQPLERDTPPFAKTKGLPRLGVHWIEPELVAQVGFAEWTADGQLRHPRFLGLREDKSPADVVRERPAR